MICISTSAVSSTTLGLMCYAEVRKLQQIPCSKFPSASMQAHHNHDTDSPHSGYISGVCHNTAVEVFDSVTLLALLVVADKESHYQTIWNLDKLIIVLSSLNLMLPTVALYMLSMSGRPKYIVV